jgi:hypothetical protein
LKDFVYVCDKAYTKEDILGWLLSYLKYRNGKQDSPKPLV